jgi:hypothetical protein
MIKTKKTKPDSPRALLARITREMDQPRFAESAREEEVANHHASWKPVPRKRARP